MRFHFDFMPKYITYDYLKKLSNRKKRVVVSRYGDGEYDIIIGEKKKSARQIINKRLTKNFIKAVNTPGQLICLPAKTKITKKNLYKVKNVKFSDLMSRYIVGITKHELYGQGQWRMIDLIKNRSELITEFFLGRTLIVTGHKEVSEYSFRKFKNIHIYEVPLVDACSEYENVYKDLVKFCNKYTNIVFGCGPLSNLLIARLIKDCNCNLIDIGSIIGIIINPYSSDGSPVNKWSGVGKKTDKRLIKEYSMNFFNTLRKKFGMRLI